MTPRRIHTLWIVPRKNNSLLNNPTNVVRMIDTAEIVSYHDLISQKSEINAAIK